MDVRHYFNAVDFSLLIEKSTTGYKYCLGTTIEKYTRKSTSGDMQKIDLAIVGIPMYEGEWQENGSQTPDLIRKELYKLSGFSDSLHIVDFGNLKNPGNKKSAFLALRDIIEYFNELNITTIVIGGSQDLSIGIGQAFRSKPYFSFATVDALLDVKKGVEKISSDNYLSKLFTDCPGLFQFGLLAYQRHLFHQSFFSKIKGINTSFRLGKLRENIAQAEPVLRNSNVLSFDINSVKQFEKGGINSVHTNGLNGDEACQLARYGGLSEELKVFGMFNVYAETSKTGYSVLLSAQILWYFIDGFIVRQHENPNHNEQMVSFKVEVKGVGNPIVFKKSLKTNRWWMEIESTTNKKMYIACSEDEYKQASNNEIPWLWIQCIQKTDEILK